MVDATMNAHGSTVLVVEDERKIRDLVRGYLEREGLSVLTTASGAEAITISRTARPDLLVLDLRQPDVPGEEVAREVRDFSQVPTLMLTAKAGQEDRIRGLELGKTAGAAFVEERCDTLLVGSCGRT
jgi:DNA-binding response OmpR family regulator